MNLKAFFTLSALAVASLQTAHASLILNSMTPVDLNGTGLGNVNTILTVNSPANSTSESGCVGLVGGVQTIGGAACQGTVVSNGSEKTGQSQTGLVSVASTGLTNASDLRVIFNASQSGGGAITLNQVALTLYSSSNTPQTFTFPTGITYTLPDTLTGTGNSGFVFRLDDQQAAAAQAFFSATTQIGLSASLSGATGGNETFFIAGTPSNPGGGGGAGSPVPEPATIGLVGIALTAVGLSRRKSA